MTPTHVARTLRGLSFVAAVMVAGQVLAQTPQQIAASQDRWEQQWQAAQLYAALYDIPMRVTLPDGRRGRLVRVEDGKPIYWFTRDRQAAITVSANRVWPGGSSGLGLTGAGILGGVWDVGTMANHPEFAGRLTVMENTGADEHANQCGGAMGAAGVNTNARGVAYQITFRSWDSGNDRTEVLQAVSNFSMKVSNHSYGPVVGWVFGLRGPRWGWLGDPAISQTQDWQLGAYGNDAKTWDETQYNAPSSLIVIAAGNQRLDGPETQPVEHDVFENGNWTVNTTQVRDRNGGPLGFDSLPTDTTAKNPLVVGAVEKNLAGYTGPSGVRMSSFSVWGPTDDGRIKPDLVAPGVNLFMPGLGSGYSFADGTSFAAPVAAGVIALFQQQYIRAFGSAAQANTLKTLAIHTADEAGPAVGPDYSFGWGQINALAGSQLIETAIFNPEFIRQRRLTSGQTFTQTIRVGSGDLRVTLGWFDPAGVEQVRQLNPRDRRLVNDLDLRVIRVSTGEVFEPWRLDVANPTAPATRGDNSVDNVEQVFIPNALAGEYIIRVSHKGSNLRPTNFQDFAVVTSAPVAGGLTSLSINPSNVVAGQQGILATVGLAEPQAEPTTLQVTTSNSAAVQVPSTITVPAGSTSFTFQVNARPVQTQQTARIFVGGSLGSVNAEMVVQPVTLTGSLSLNLSEVFGGATATGTVTLGAPAPSGGVTVQLASNAPSVARPTRNWIVIPGGRTTGTFTVQTFPVVSNENITIRATRGSVTNTASLTVKRQTLTEFGVNVSSVRGGLPVTGTVTLSGPAPTGGASVQLTSSNTAFATVPATVTVPAGQRTRTFTITTRRPSASTAVTISASRLGDTRQRTITINP